MSGICGWFAAGPVDDAAARLARMGARLGRAADDALPGNGPLLARAGATPTACVERSGFILAVIGHPRLITDRPADDRLAAMAELLRRDGARALDAIGGDFALATWDVDARRGLVAIDRIGVQSLVYREVNGAIAFASTIDALAEFPGAVGAISRQAVFDYLYFHVCPGPTTIYEKVRRLSAGHYIEFDERGVQEEKPYWRMAFSEGADDFAGLKAEFVELLSTATREAASGAEVGAFLSGGTDSSTVSGKLKEVAGGRPRVYSIGFDAEGYDEMGYARIAARHFGCEHIEHYVTPADVVEAVPRIASFYDQPFGNASAIPTYYCARLAAEHGVGRMLAGDGGDELFGGNDRYAKQYLLGLYHHLPQPVRGGLVEPVALSAAVNALPMVRKLGSYVRQASPAMPWRYESYNLLNHLGAANVLAPDLLASVDPRHPQALLATAHAPYAQSSLINQMLGIDLRLTLADGDLPKVTRMCELAGVDVAFPLLDDRVVAFSAKLPSDFKLRRTQLRWFFKEALRDFLPREVIEKEKHGFGLPVGAWLVGHRPLYDLAADAVRSLRPHGIVRDAFIEEILGPRLAEHPKYYGTMVWILMMLGLWLDARRR